MLGGHGLVRSTSLAYGPRAAFHLLTGQARRRFATLAPRVVNASRADGVAAAVCQGFQRAAGRRGGWQHGLQRAEAGTGVFGRPVAMSPVLQGWQTVRRTMASRPRLQPQRVQSTFVSTQTVLLYCLSGGLVFFGLSYASVPLYQIFCRATGAEGTTNDELDVDRIRNMEAVRDLPIRIRFVADTKGDMLWDFEPCQDSITVVPGETALAFFTATNKTDQPITGISTYNVLPFEAGPYFNKIQCFCFEEQRLEANEEVDMPVFFYIDPDFYDDPAMYNVDEILLSYTFFKAKEFGAPEAQPHARPSTAAPVWAQAANARKATDEDVEDVLPTLGATAVSRAKHVTLDGANKATDGELYNSSNRSKGIF